MMKFAKVVTLVSVLVVLGSMASFAGGTKEAAGGVKIGLSMDSLESAFWVANYDAMIAKAKTMGVQLIPIMAEGDAAKQNQQMENLIAQKVKAIICSPKDGAAIVATVKKAQAAGIPVIMNNRPIQGKDVTPALSVLSDNYVMGREVLKWFAEKARKEGKKYKTILLIGNLADENAVERQKGHKEVLAAYKDIFTVVAEIPTEWNHEIALKGLQNALQANPDANLIVTPSDFLYPPIRSALEQVKRWAKIGDPAHMSIVSFDGDEGGMQYLKDGYSEADAAQGASFTGEYCVEWAVKLANGEKPANAIYRDPGIIVTMDNFKEVAPKVWSYKSLK